MLRRGTWHIEWADMALVDGVWRLSLEAEAYLEDGWEPFGISTVFWHPPDSPNPHPAYTERIYMRKKV